MGACSHLASGDDGLDIMRCPEGHIHIEMKGGAFELRFDDAAFLAFAQTISSAATLVEGRGRAGSFPAQYTGPSKSN